MSPLTVYVVETVVSVLAVLALAVLVLYGARRLGVGRPTGPLSLVGRLPLDGRRTVYLVRVGSRVYVVGGSEHGLSKLGEVSERSLVDAEGTEPAPSFVSALSRVLGAPRRGRSGQPDEPGDRREEGGKDAP